MNFDDKLTGNLTLGCRLCHSDIDNVKLAHMHSNLLDLAWLISP